MSEYLGMSYTGIVIVERVNTLLKVPKVLKQENKMELGINATEEQIKIISEEVEQKMLSVKRDGMERLVRIIKKYGYFESPSSTKHHSAYKGGLVIHCYKIEQLFRQLLDKFGIIDFPEESIIICCYFHDFCKVKQYIETENGFKTNPNNKKGHALLSLERLKQCITLTEDEELIIKYHMGMYGTHEFGYVKEYSIRELGRAFNNRIAKLFYFCDDMSSQFLEK